MTVCQIIPEIFYLSSDNNQNQQWSSPSRSWGILHYDTGTKSRTEDLLALYLYPPTGIGVFWCGI